MSEIIITKVTQSAPFRMMPGMRWRPASTSRGQWFRLSESDIIDAERVRERGEIVVDVIDPATFGCLHEIACEWMQCAMVGVHRFPGRMVWCPVRSVGGATYYHTIPEDILAAFPDRPFLAAVLAACLHEKC